MRAAIATNMTFEIVGFTAIVVAQITHPAQSPCKKSAPPRSAGSLRLFRDCIKTMPRHLMYIRSEMKKCTGMC